MKYMIASDLHGSAEYVSRLMEDFRQEGADGLLLLGDLLYHGPRNALPRGYDTKSVISMLNDMAEYIIAVRGNCDAEVDQMVLDFPIMEDYVVLTEGDRQLFLTHGHLYTPEEPPALLPGDVMLSGHTHVPASFRNESGVWFVNPGSVSIPKNGSPHSYMTLEDGSCAFAPRQDAKPFRNSLSPIDSEVPLKNRTEYDMLALRVSTYRQSG